MAFFSFFKKKSILPTVTFATTCWEKDWRYLLQHPSYLKEQQIGNHDFPFTERMVVINNVNEYKEPIAAAEELKNKNILTEYYVAKDYYQKVLDFFHLRREDFTAGPDAHLYEGVDDEWIFYNAIGILTALYFCKTDYFLYLTGDCYLKEKINWIPKAIELMEKKKMYKVANLTHDYKYAEAKKESYKKDKDFYISKSGFSDQCFLVKRKNFQSPIYSEIRKDSNHFPRGDVFEKRVFSYMKNHGWLRLFYRKGSYIHENF